MPSELRIYIYFLDTIPLCLYHYLLSCFEEPRRKTPCLPGSTGEYKDVDELKTYSVKQADITRKWYLVDAEGIPLGRLAAELAKILRGKNKPTFTPHLDVGDNVIVINADKVVLTGNKLQNKVHYTHSGYPGGLKETSYEVLMRDRPQMVVEKAVRGMLPKNRLGRATIKKLHVYAGAEHPHKAQAPEAISFDIKSYQEGR
jgi:large subunit ribosomal protein L13